MNTGARPDRPRLLCCGSLNLDVTAEPTEPGTAKRRKGRVAARPGGGAFNMAADLKAHETEPRLLAAVNDGPLARLFRDALTDAGIEAVLHQQPDLADSIFVGWFEDGDLVRSLGNNVGPAIRLPEAIIEAALDGIDGVILTLAFDDALCRDIAQRTLAANLPLFLAVNSEARARRLPRLAHAAPGAEAAFMNHDEAQALCDLLKVSSPQGAADTLKLPLVVTAGAQGLTLHQPETPPTPVAGQSLPVTGNTLGAGDLIVAATAYFRVVEGLPLNQAVAWAPTRMAELLKRTEAYLDIG
ncbi:carbohydrate kinase family protein [Roseospirillum parvum]|uniref:Sugar or nucleoside kinase, ribokinase family n=1 Tax=Roseospirillum parvum TaxID=83401 RepID=A0A1G8CI97_9PROT|nr:carbohydrate kinase family protein [Roseospirillum parvum]SDH45138.1 Sugar or nucleoside kinase, ribokinase family [Roseospirillum parvum]